MANYKCKMCGGALITEPGQNIAECGYCGSRQTIPVLDDNKKLALFSRANTLRSNCEFDQAGSVFELIMAQFPDEPEGFWGSCISKYGILYVDDPADGRKVPTCNRTLFESILDDPEYKKAVSLAQGEAGELYKSEAAEIDRLQKGILRIVETEDPYDIFICYKEQDEEGKRTADSVKAQEIYDALTDLGYRVFFSRITLENKLGEEFEPYIFSALQSSKIMLAVGTSSEYFDAVWVKNEWSRFLNLVKTDRSRLLIPLYMDMDAYDMPPQFQNLQAQDMGKIGFLQDLLRGIAKIIPPPKEAATVERSDKGANLTKRGFEALAENDFDAAKNRFEKAIAEDPSQGKAYLGMYLAQEQYKCKAVEFFCEKLDEYCEYFATVGYTPEKGLFDKGDGAYTYMRQMISSACLENAFSNFYACGNVDAATMWIDYALEEYGDSVGARLAKYVTDTVPQFPSWLLTLDTHHRPLENDKARLIELYASCNDEEREWMDSLLEAEIRQEEAQLAALKECWYQRAMAVKDIRAFRTKAEDVFRQLGDYKDSTKFAGTGVAGFAGRLLRDFL